MLHPEIRRGELEGTRRPLLLLILLLLLVVAAPLRPGHPSRGRGGGDVLQHSRLRWGQLLRPVLASAGIAGCDRLDRRALVLPGGARRGLCVRAAAGSGRRFRRCGAGVCGRRY